MLLLGHLELLTIIQLASQPSLQSGIEKGFILPENGKHMNDKVEVPVGPASRAEKNWPGKKIC